VNTRRVRYSTRSGSLTFIRDLNHWRKRMIINKSCAFQLPSTVQMQKNIFGVQKINNRRRRFSSFQSCCGTSQKNIGAPSCARKNGPSV